MTVIINATLINLYHVCPRECWLHAKGIRMEHTSDTVYDGKLLHDVSYPQRPEQYTEVELSAEWNGITLTGKVDFYDPTRKVIHETKRSDKVEIAHEWQLKYYIWLFELNLITDVKGILEYPKLRQTAEISCSNGDKSYLKLVIEKVRTLIASSPCPPKIHKRICKSCSFHDLCYIDEI